MDNKNPKNDDPPIGGLILGILICLSIVILTPWWVYLIGGLILILTYVISSVVGFCNDPFRAYDKKLDILEREYELKRKENESRRSAETAKFEKDLQQSRAAVIAALKITSDSEKERDEEVKKASANFKAYNEFFSDQRFLESLKEFNKEREARGEKPLDLNNVSNKATNGEFDKGDPLNSSDQDDNNLEQIC